MYLAYPYMFIPKNRMSVYTLDNRKFLYSMLQISDADMIQASADKTVTTRNEKMGGEFGTLTVPSKRK